MEKPSSTPPSGDLTVQHPVTAYDVARAAGVSQSAVSRAFTPGTSISAEMRLKVENAAQRLGYRPNLIARSLSKRRSHTVGVIVPPMENLFFAMLVEDLSLALHRVGYRMLLYSSRSMESSSEVLENVISARADALIAISASISSHFVEECRRMGVAMVLLNRKTSKSNVSFVTGDNTLGAERIASFLVAGGHVRCAYLAGLDSTSTSRDREDGFTRRLQELGRPLAARAAGGFTTEGAITATRELLSATMRPDAIFCANDHMAYAAIQVARGEFGLVPGRDISIVGFDDAPQAAWPSFDLTTYLQPTCEMAEQAVKLVQAQLEQAQPAESMEVIVPGELVVRSSALLPPSGVAGPPCRRIWREESEDTNLARPIG